MTRCRPVDPMRHSVGGFRATTAPSSTRDGQFQARHSPRAETARRNGCFLMKVRRRFRPLGPGFVKNPFSQMPVVAPSLNSIGSGRTRPEIFGNHFAVMPRRDQTALFKLCPDVGDFAAPTRHPGQPPAASISILMKKIVTCANRRSWSARCARASPLHKAATRPDFVACEGVALV